MEYNLSEIFIYPVKSLNGIAQKSAEVTDRGLKFDRRWMIVDENGKFITQRTHPQLALVNVELSKDTLIFSHRVINADLLVVPRNEHFGKIEVNIWNDNCDAAEINKDAEKWFSDILGFNCRLVYMPDETKRYVDKKYALHNEIVSFADAYPALILGRQSLTELNSRLDKKITMSRFRPNLVFEGGEPYDEDGWGRFKIGNITFSAVKPCSRCVFITVDQETGIKGEEPLKTLSTYRRESNSVLFGQNLVYEGIGTVNVGDKIEVIDFKEKPAFI